jgi:hypothetical protein
MSCIVGLNKFKIDKEGRELRVAFVAGGEWWLVFSVILWIKSGLIDQFSQNWIKTNSISNWDKKCLNLT